MAVKRAIWWGAAIPNNTMAFLLPSRKIRTTTRDTHETIENVQLQGYVSKCDHEHSGRVTVRGGTGLFPGAEGGRPSDSALGRARRKP